MIHRLKNKSDCTNCLSHVPLCFLLFLTFSSLFLHCFLCFPHVFPPSPLSFSPLFVVVLSSFLPSFPSFLLILCSLQCAYVSYNYRFQASPSELFLYPGFPKEASNVIQDQHQYKVFGPTWKTKTIDQIIDTVYEIDKPWLQVKNALSTK